ncbi:EamA family transporter [Paraflavitalea speifideaquila]|uniref:EamA family transporter n=1 Tax=Paraflavitalea speifideaquila TaxID=3076558 RepID=UPI0028F067BD|nr:EamA family transporter [Paraflavitalea speifideiaquila]
MGFHLFFIAKAVAHIPPFILGTFRYIAAGLLLLLWCALKKEKLFNLEQLKHASVTGIMLLFIGNGAVIWVEKTLPSSLVGVLIASQAIWLVLLDKANWKINFTSRNTIIGLLIGFAGVVLLFFESVSGVVSNAGGAASVISFLILLVGMLSWSGGSIYSKKHSSGSTTVNSAWQMLIAGLVFIPASFINNEWAGFDWQTVPAESWFATLYLVVFGSLAAYSAYVWLLSVRPVTQVSTHVYVNPVVAVLLGVLFAGEHMSWLQVVGLGVILASVLLINLSKYRKQKPVNESINRVKPEGKMMLAGTGKQAVCTDC